MKTLAINDVVLPYEGKPLRAFCLSTDGYWSGRSNFKASNAKIPEEQLASLNDCFLYMSYWKSLSDYQCGYVLDYDSHTVYYDTEVALDAVKKRVIASRGLDGYFTTFIPYQF